MSQAYGSDPRAIYHAAVSSVLPSILVTNAVQYDRFEGTLIVQGVKYFLNHNVRILAFGKAVLAMLSALEGLIGDHIVEGVASIPTGSLELAKKHHPEWLPMVNSRVRIYEGAPRNIPDCTAERAARDVLGVARSAGDQDLLIVLISGGGSALLPCPVEGVSLDEKRKGSLLFAKAGANIHDMNNFRKSISLIKGGRLAAAAYPTKLLALILSDVIGSPLDIIASGPTVPNTTPTQEVLRTIDRYGLREAMPPSIIRHLENTAPGDDLCPLLGQTYAHVQNVIIGSNSQATAAASHMARTLGYNTYVWSHCVEGEARTVGEMYATVAVALGSSSSPSLPPDGFSSTPRLAEDFGHLCSALPSLRSQLPLCLIGAGEPTVQLKGAGRGGRSQELVLAAAIRLDQLIRENPSMDAYDIQLLSGGTDGEDGPCDAAGAVIDAGVVRRAGDQGINPQAYLDNNDSYGFFSQLCGGGCLIRTGLTGTNVMDMHVLCIRRVL